MSPPIIGRLSLWEKCALGIEILGAYARVRLSLRRGGLPRALSDARTASSRVERHAGHLRGLDDARLARAAILVLRMLPTDTRCLMRSLVVLGLLARRGRNASLVIGVEPGSEFRAHSWLEAAGRPLLPTEGFSQLVVL